MTSGHSRSDVARGAPTSAVNWSIDPGFRVHLPATATRRATKPRPTTRRDRDVADAVDALRRILRSLRLAARFTESSAGLSAAQLYVLSAVAANGPSSLSDLASRTMTDRSSVAAVVDRLSERGLVRRGFARDDRRRAAVTLTPTGRRALDEAPTAPTQRLIAGLNALPLERLKEAARSLTALTEAMGIDGEPAGMFFEDPPKSPASRARRPLSRLEE
jgi:DNA-binding MarR family transcriptional regulator